MLSKFSSTPSKKDSLLFSGKLFLVISFPKSFLMFGTKQFLACETESITFSLLLSFSELLRVSSGIVVMKFSV